MGLCSECLRDQRACLLQLGASSIMIGTQFDKTFLDPSFVFRGGLRNLIIQCADFGVGVLLQLLRLSVDEISQNTASSKISRGN
jgi:hypothetical protein